MLVHKPHSTSTNAQPIQKLNTIRDLGLFLNAGFNDLIGIHKIVHGLLDFPCDAIFAAPTRPGLCVVLSKFTNSGVKPGVTNMRSTF